MTPATGWEWIPALPRDGVALSELGELFQPAEAVRDQEQAPAEGSKSQEAVPPALGHATAPVTRPWRGFAIAAVAHLALLAGLVVIKVHMPVERPEMPAISVVMASAPQGETARPAPQPPVKQPAPVLQKPVPPPVPQPTANPAPVQRADKADQRPHPVPRPSPPAPARAAGATAAPGQQVAGAKAPAAGGITRPARAITKLTVYYSMYSREHDQQGEVRLSVVVQADGSVGSVRVVQSSGIAAFDTVARNAVMGLRFQPALKDGVPVASTLAYLFRFELQ